MSDPDGSQDKIEAKAGSPSGHLDLQGSTRSKPDQENDIPTYPGRSTSPQPDEYSPSLDSTRPSDAVVSSPVSSARPLQAPAPSVVSNSSADMLALSPSSIRRRPSVPYTGTADQGDDEEEDAAGYAQASSSRRQSSGKLASFIDKLKHRRPSEHNDTDGRPSGPSSTAVMDPEDEDEDDGRRSPIHELKSTISSRLASGKHTPKSGDDEQPSGDYGKFVKAAELKEKLENEQTKAAERELKLAKKTAKKKKPGHVPRHSEISAAGRSPQDPVEPPSPLEEKKRFPGGFEKPPVTRRPSSRSAQKNGQSSPGGLQICGTDIYSTSEDETPSEDDEKGSKTLLNDGIGDGQSLQPSSPESKRPIPTRQDSTSSSSSSEGSIASLAPLPLQRGKKKSASEVSLKSWGSTDSPGARSLASGSASHKLSAPLLELEELELRSFLRNFNRHTREVRVPASAHFPRRRMPQWDDFRIPPGEAALAAREGKRVTVLTHVDRGLQALAKEEGAGAPPGRSAPLDPSEKDKERDKHNWFSGKARSSSHRDDEEIRQHKVTWAPDTGFIPEQMSRGRAAEDEEDAKVVFGGGLRNRGTQERNERRAKNEEDNIGIETEDGDKGPRIDPKKISLGGKGRLPRESVSSSSTVNIHDSQTEFRPSRDEIPTTYTDGKWELIDEFAHTEAEVDASEGDRVDGVAFCIAYILALVERYAPEELDNTPDQTYRENRARSHLERLYIIAPFWERLGFGLRRLYRWDDPTRTATAAMVYFVLWWTDLIPTAFFLTLIYYILQFRYFPPEANFLHEQVRVRMARGVEADKLAERLRRRSRLDILEIYRRFTTKYGIAVQIGAGDIADFHEKVKNLILWRNPQATWRTLSLFIVLTFFVTFLPAYYLWKLFFFFIGFTFFCLLPLQSHYPRYRRPLSPFWWALWGSPTDAQFAIQLLRRRHLERAEAEMDIAAKKVKGSKSSSGGGSNGKSSHDGGELGKKSIRKIRSEAAHAVKGGSMRPLEEGQERTLYGLEEEVLDSNDNDNDTPNEVNGSGVDSDGNPLPGTARTTTRPKKFRPKKLDSFFCQHHGVPGHLTVTTRQLYFRGLGQSKSCKTPLEDIAGLSKTKSLQLLVWHSSGLQIARTNKRSLFFSNMVKRDECFNLILAVGSEIWSKV